MSYSCTAAIANKHLYLFNPDNDDQSTYSQKAYLINDTKQWDWISRAVNVSGLTYVGLAENKLYHIKIATNNYTPTITEFPMPAGHTKCISCNQYYGAYNILIVPIFQ